MPLTAYGLGMGFVVLTMFLLPRLDGSQGAIFPARYIACFFVATSFPIVWWSMSGMETGLYAFLITFATYRYFRRPLDRVSWSYVLALNALLVCRSEAGLFWPVFFVLSAWTAQRKGGGGWSVVFIEHAMALCSFALYAGFRFLYYHDFFSQPYYVKLSVDHAPFTLLGVDYMRRFVEEYLAHGVLLLFLVGLLFGRSRGAAASVVVLICAYAIFPLKAGDFKLHFRFVAPILPLLYWLLADSLVRMLRLLDASGWHRFARHWRYPLAIMMIALVVGASVLPIHRVADVNELSPRRAWQKMKDPLSSETNTHMETARWLNENVPPDSTVAYDQAGKGPYYAPKTVRFVDTYGLVSRDIGRARGERRQELIFAEKPDYWIFWTIPHHRRLMAGTIPRAEFNQNYRLHDVIGSPARILIFVRDEAHGRQIPTDVDELIEGFTRMRGSTPQPR